MRPRSHISEAWVGTLALLGTVSIWGFVPVATRSLVDDMSPAQILLVRFGFGAIIALGIFVFIRPGLPNRPLLGKAILLGVFGALGFNAPLAYGINIIEAGIAALLLGMQPVIIATLAAVYLRERIAPRMVVGLVVALAGSSLIAVTGGGSEIDLSARYMFGCGLILLATAIYAVYSVVVKPYLGTSMPPASVPLLGALFSSLFVIPLAVPGFASALADLNAPGWLAVLLLSFGATIIAPVLFNIGLSRHLASQAGIFLYLIPVFGLISSVILLGEQLNAVVIAGGTLIIVGVLLATFSPAALETVSEIESAAD